MSDLLGTLGSVIGVLDGINARQSCVVTVVNETAETLTLTSHVPAHGDFVTLPALNIPPGQSDTFGTSDKAVSVLTGTEATVIYSVGGKTTWTIHWDNPGDLVESNGADAHLDPEGVFTSTSEMAGGNDKVPVRFVIHGPGGGVSPNPPNPNPPNPNPPNPNPPNPNPPATDRRSSCLITVNNHTNVTLGLFDQGHDHGEFVTVPPLEIPPGESASFSSFETEGSNAEGSQGFVVWGIGDNGLSTWTIRWNNQEAADNTTDSVLAGPDVAGLHGIDQIGAGDENVPATFTLRGHVGAQPTPPDPNPPVPPDPNPPIPPDPNPPVPPDPNPPVPPDPNPPVPPDPNPPQPEEDFTPPAETGEPTLRQGDNSADGWVEYLQESLNLAGFGPLTPDGAFGPGTHHALIEFQKAKGLMVDGVAGNQTWAALRGEAPQDPSTDGRDPHTYVEQGPEARWFTESDSMTVSEGTISIWAVSTGDTPIVPGQFPATARITLPSGEEHVVHLTSTTGDAQPAGQGAFLYYVSAQLPLDDEGTYTVEAFLPAELGGDETIQQFTLPQ